MGYIIPSLTNRDEESSLNAFRDRYCWTEHVNCILEVNLEGIMEIFTMFMGSDDGFTIDCAIKFLKGIGSVLSLRTINMLFDLS